MAPGRTTPGSVSRPTVSSTSAGRSATAASAACVHARPSSAAARHAAERHVHERLRHRSGRRPGRVAEPRDPRQTGHGRVLELGREQRQVRLRRPGRTPDRPCVARNASTFGVATRPSAVPSTPGRSPTLACGSPCSSAATGARVLRRLVDHDVRPPRGDRLAQAGQRRGRRRAWRRSRRRPGVRLVVRQAGQPLVHGRHLLRRWIVHRPEPGVAHRRAQPLPGRPRARRAHRPGTTGRTAPAGRSARRRPSS